MARHRAGRKSGGTVFFRCGFPPESSLGPERIYLTAQNDVVDDVNAMTGAAMLMADL